MLNHHTIKLIYCYLVCLFLAVYLTTSVYNLGKNTVDLIRREPEYAIPHDLKFEYFHQQKSVATIPHQQREERREKAIFEHKKEAYHRLKSRLWYDGFAIIVSLIALGIHIVLIRNKKSCTTN